MRYNEPVVCKLQKYHAHCMVPFPPPDCIQGKNFLQYFIKYVIGNQEHQPMLLLSTQYPKCPIFSSSNRTSKAHPPRRRTTSNSILYLLVVFEQPVTGSFHGSPGFRKGLGK